MQPAPKAQTVGRTAGLTGFESEEHGHVLSLLLRVTLVEPKMLCEVFTNDSLLLTGFELDSDSEVAFRYFHHAIASSGC